MSTESARGRAVRVRSADQNFAQNIRRLHTGSAHGMRSTLTRNLNCKFEIFDCGPNLESDE